jgi:hypothetical protein
LGFEIDVEHAALQLDRDFVLNLECDTCKNVQEILQPSCKVPAATATCPNCNSQRRPNMVHAIGLDDESVASGLADMTLDRLGIPGFEIVRVRINAEQIAWMRMDSDRPEWLDKSSSEISPLRETSDG